MIEIQVRSDLPKVEKWLVNCIDDEAQNERFDTEDEAMAYGASLHVDNHPFQIIHATYQVIIQNFPA